MKKIVSLLILSLFYINALADERLYKIELLIFSQKMPNTEVFDQTESKIAWPRNVANRLSYKSVSSGHMLLRDSYRRIARSANYKPLMHVAWIQSARSNSNSRAIKITNDSGTIDGFFRIQRGHLIHMMADIEYTPTSSFSERVIYRLNEKRRFKLKETHYFDHPKFGILARVSPVK